MSLMLQNQEGELGMCFLLFSSHNSKGTIIFKPTPIIIIPAEVMITVAGTITQNVVTYLMGNPNQFFLEHNLSPASWSLSGVGMQEDKCMNYVTV